MSLVKDKLKLFDEIEKELLDNISYLNKRVLRAVNKKLLAFEIKGGLFVETADAPVIVAELKKEIRSIIDTDFKPQFNDWIKNYDQITKLNIAIQKSVNKLSLAKAMFSDSKAVSVDKVVSDLVGIGMDVNFIDPMTQALMRNVSLGSTVSDTQDYLEAYIHGYDDTNGKLQRYAGQLARDSVSQFDGQLNQQIMNEFDMDGFSYVGSIVEDSRPFCVHVVEELGGFIPQDDIQDLLDEYLNSVPKSRGMIAETTAETFAVYRGGWNCRHAAIPIYKDNV